MVVLVVVVVVVVVKVVIVVVTVVILVIVTWGKNGEQHTCQQAKEGVVTVTKIRCKFESFDKSYLKMINSPDDSSNSGVVAILDETSGAM